MQYEMLREHPKQVFEAVSKAMGVHLGDELFERAFNIVNRTHVKRRVDSPHGETMFIQQSSSYDIGLATDAAVDQFKSSAEYEVSVETFKFELSNWWLGKGSIEYNDLWDAK